MPYKGGQNEKLIVFLCISLGVINSELYSTQTELDFYKGVGADGIEIFTPVVGVVTNNILDYICGWNNT